MAKSMSVPSAGHESINCVFQKLPSGSVKNVDIQVLLLLKTGIWKERLKMHERWINFRKNFSGDDDPS